MYWNIQFKNNVIQIKYILFYFQMGTHTELIKKKGLYYTLINEQDRENTW